MLFLWCFHSLYSFCVNALIWSDIFFLCCTVWNGLPCQVRSSNTLMSFKSSLKSYLFMLSGLHVCVRTHACVCTCMHACRSLFWLPFVPWLGFVLCPRMGYVLQFGEIAHKRAGPYYHKHQNINHAAKTRGRYPCSWCSCIKVKVTPNLCRNQTRRKNSI